MGPGYSSVVPSDEGVLPFTDDDDDDDEEDEDEDEYNVDHLPDLFMTYAPQLDVCGSPVARWLWRATESWPWLWMPHFVVLRSHENDILPSGYD